jgi:ketosteroid isomerase-like protein
MKTKYLTILIIVFLMGCSTHLSAQMTSEEQETAKKEILEAVSTIFKNLHNMDAEALYQSYAESPDFIQISTEGSMVDFQNAKNLHAKWFTTLSSLNVTPIKETFRFLPCNTVIYLWLGKFEMTTKQGRQLKVDQFGITFIFRKMDSQWKVIFQQGSSLPPVSVKE